MKRYLWLVFLVLAPLLAHADPVTLTYSLPIQNVDGSPLTDLAKLRIYDSTKATDLSPLAEITDLTQTSWTAPLLPPGPHYFAITAVNSQGQESAQTGPVSTTIVAALLTAGPYSYEPTGTATAPTMSAIGLVDASLPCGPATRLVGIVKFCQITHAQTDLIGWPVDRTLKNGLWAKAQ